MSLGTTYVLDNRHNQRPKSYQPESKYSDDR
ncbi:Uncharacterised protein [Serratia proteamaculans]|nr:Uncharacterised protein [Serratia proteamaculans]CAI1611951.1 Uncharacterised protein [Serratia proteamaculans]